MSEMDANRLALVINLQPPLRRGFFLPITEPLLPMVRDGQLARCGYPGEGAHRFRPGSIIVLHRRGNLTAGQSSRYEMTRPPLHCVRPSDLPTPASAGVFFCNARAILGARFPSKPVERLCFLQHFE